MESVLHFVMTVFSISFKMKLLTYWAQTLVYPMKFAYEFPWHPILLAIFIMTSVIKALWYLSRQRHWLMHTESGPHWFDHQVNWQPGEFKGWRRPGKTGCYWGKWRAVLVLWLKLVISADHHTAHKINNQGEKGRSQNILRGVDKGREQRNKKVKTSLKQRGG